MIKKNIEIIKNGKIYNYVIPNTDKYDYIKIAYFLADLDITRNRINHRFCVIYSKNRILTKLSKFFGKNKIESCKNNNEKIYCYLVTLFNDEEWKKYSKDFGWK